MESVYYIQHEMTLGYVIRGIHHYAASAMVVLMGIHLIQVVIDGAYKAPREVNFWLGIVLLQIVLGLSLTGYLLPWDQKGYYATQVTTNIMSATPLVGGEVQQLAQGGSQYGHLTLTRFFAMHAGVLPMLLVGFLALHIYVFRRHGLTACDTKRGADAMFWPDQVLKDAVACLAVLAVVLLAAVFKGAELNAPADPAVKFDAARPEWYFLFLFRLLRFEVIDELGTTVGAIVIPGIIMGIIAVMPLTARFLGEAGHKLNKAFIWLLTAGILVLTVMAIVEDNANVGHQAAIAEAHRDAARALELASGPDRIPVDGAVSLLRRDPFTRGPRLFAQHCSACHRYNGHDGRGMLVMENQQVAPPTAADLGNFASREWMKNVVVDFPGHFAALKNATWYRDAKDAEAKGEEVAYIDPDTSVMADWSDNTAALKSAENAQDLDALAEFLISEAGHAGIDVDETRAARGRELAIDGAWQGTLDGASCLNCHTSIGNDFSPISDEDADDAPTLAKYGSQAWLKDFIRHPNAARHYGARNRMKAYSPEQLSDEDLNLLVRWMTGDYLPTKVDDYPSAVTGAAEE
ncbi:MAG: cytochrome b N-terminal domain-containing protein [Planctomycetaceae bacterium]